MPSNPAPRTGITLLSTACLAFLSACAPATFRPSGGAKVVSKPTWQERKPYFFLGMVGEHEIDVGPICGDRPVDQMQTQFAFTDILITLISVGVYTPKTARVWCADGDDGQEGP